MLSLCKAISQKLTAKSQSLYQVNQREQDNPDHIDKMPIKAKHLKANRILIVVTLIATPQNNQSPKHTNRHVSAMESRRSIETHPIIGSAIPDQSAEIRIE